MASFFALCVEPFEVMLGLFYSLKCHSFGPPAGHRALSEAHILHRDVSVNNILIDSSDSSGILIDLDLAAKVHVDGAPHLILAV